MTTAAIAAGRAKTAMATEKGIPVVPKTDKKDVDTELVMVLERRGEGWAEEVFPHVVMKRKPIPASRRTQKDLVPDTAQSFLTEKLGFSQDEAASIVSAAAAWRVTRGGRALVDRKLMRVVQENTPAAVAALLQVGASTAHIPTLLRNTPQILAVVPNSEWNRNLLEYIVRTKVPGGGRFGPLKLKHARRVPSKKQLAAMEKHRRKGEDPRTIRTGADPMKPWVEDVRKRRTSGQLSQEQLYMIDVAGFDAEVKGKKADESRRTWEMWFDELVEYQVATGTCEIPEERQDAGLGRWLDRQRQKNAKGTLPLKAYTRLHALGVSFEGFEAPASATEPTEQDERMIIDSAAAMVKLRRAAPLDMAPRGPGEEQWADDPALDRKSVDMVRSLLDFQRREGRFVEPPLGSPLAVWLSRTRARAASEDPDGPHGAMSPEERAALERAGVELENFSASWLTELERFASLRAHRVTLHDPIALAAFERQQRELSFAGALSRARLLRLRQAGMKGLRCTSEDEDELFRGAPENRRPPLFGVHRPLAGQIETISMRENVLAAEAAAAAREEAKRTAEGDARVERRRPPARARSRPARTVIAGGATTTTAKTKTRRRAARDVDEDGELNGDGDGDGDGDGEGEGDVEDIVSTAVTSTSTRA